MSANFFFPTPDLRLLAFWQKAEKTAGAGRILMILGILCFLSAIWLTSWFWFFTGIVFLGAGINLLIYSRKTWSQQAMECSYTINEPSTLKAVAVSALLQNPTVLLTGFPGSPDLILVFTAIHAFILQLGTGEAMESRALALKEEIKSHFTGPWQNAELCQPAVSIQEISAQCDYIAGEYCTEPLAKELADVIGRFAASANAVVLFGRPFPKTFSATTLERVSPAPAVTFTGPGMLLKHGLALVAIIILMAGGFFFINRLNSNHTVPVSPPAETALKPQPEQFRPPVNLMEKEEGTAASTRKPNPDRPEGLRVSQRTMGSISLTWQPVPGTAGYEVMRNNRRVALTRNHFYTDEGLRPGTRYTYTVRAYNNDNSFSEPSEAFSATTVKDTIPPTAPTNLTLNIVSGKKARLNWQPATDNLAVDGYEVFRNGRKIGVTKETNYTDEQVDNENVSYTVRAFDPARNYSKHSNPAGGLLPDEIAPTTPGNITFSRTLQSVRLSWSSAQDNRGVAGYAVYRDGQKIGTTQNTFFVDEGLTPDSNYTYTIRAYDLANNYSRPSETISVRTLADTTPPSVPGQLKVAGTGSHTVRLSWAAATDNSGHVKYEIYRDGDKIGTTTATTFTVDNLAPGNSYSFRVKAVDQSGNSSAFSATVHAETEKSRVTIYYRKGFTTPYLHYQQTNGIWTVPPGVAMSEAEVAGYTKITVELGYADYLLCAFSDGKGKWDPNPPPLCQRGDSAYKFKEGTWTFENGQIKAGSP
ncbi:MAG TPA: fibronectin type III domain-containing protein [Bacillota bacterium]|nr:fibronectin type III domain-containing protein [Bacillota bacterium]HPT66914.1 fibronectin type III domain-containing protein [Bacillota bacterium]